MKIAQLKPILAKWQARLDLPEWKITLQWQRNETEDAGIEFDATRGTATVRISRTCPEADYEGAIVHELIHLTIEGHLHINAPRTDQYERAINRLERALVEAHATG